MQEQRGKWAHFSERNAKHLYIEKSQAIPGYGCQFFGVTLKVGGAGKRGCGGLDIRMVVRTLYGGMQIDFKGEYTVLYSSREVTSTK